MSKEITLQINLSPGDTESATLTVPHIVSAHSTEFAEKLLIVDCNRPQQTPIVNTDIRFPQETFQQKVLQIKSIADDLNKQGVVDRVVYLEPGDDIYKRISRKYMRGITRATHDYGACALMAYLAAFEVVSTPYLLHYDADMLIYQKKGHDWLVEALGVLQDQHRYAAVTPRLAPPLRQPSSDTPTLYQWPVSKKVASGWEDQWFSTRAFLFKRESLMNALPLLRGKRYLRAVARKLLNRGFPVSPEVMISARMKQIAKFHLQLASEDAWLLHPCDKSEVYLSILPRLIQTVKEGKVPDRQRGIPDIDLELFSKDQHVEGKQ